MEKAKVINVIATVETLEGKRDEFLAAFHSIVPQVLAEKGCIEYGPTVDVQSAISIQPPLRTNTVVIIEKWESLDALMAHLAAPHMKDYREATKDITVSTQLQVLETA